MSTAPPSRTVKLSPTTKPAIASSVLARAADLARPDPRPGAFAATLSMLLEVAAPLAVLVEADLAARVALSEDRPRVARGRPGTAAAAPEDEAREQEEHEQPHERPEPEPAVVVPVGGACKQLNHRRHLQVRWGSTRSARATGRGSHQFQRPKSETAAGTRRARTIVASSRIPAPSPVAIIFTLVSGAVAIATKPRKRIRAALVTSLPVRPRASTTAVSVAPLRGEAPPQ